MHKETQSDRAGILFLLGCGLMVAHQVAGKAVRDGLFLSRFGPSELPKIAAAAALAAVLLGLGFARILSRSGPLRLVPLAFGGGAVMHVIEFLLLRNGTDDVTAIVIPFIYLHLVGFGAILLSGFWSILNEHFDPREAKWRFGRIAGAGTLGGVCGGLLAERGAALFSVNALLLLLAALHLGTAVTLWLVPRNRRDPALQPEAGPVWSAARDAFRGAPFLVNLAALVVLGTMSAMLLDYLFKSSATATFGKGPMLTRYFAFFYAGNQLLTFLVQTLLTPVALRRLGLGRTVVWHPAAVALGASAGLFGAQVVMAPIARSLELILRGSFLRSGYELFFTPVPPREKRAVKTFIDVGCDRMGDAFGAGLLQLILLLGPQRAITPIWLIATGFALVSIWITTRMDAAYTGVLQHGLMSRAVAINESDVQDSTTLHALSRTIEVPRQAALANARSSQSALASIRQPSPRPAAQTHDAVLARLAEMRSGVAHRVAAALRSELPFDPLLLPQAISLLAWNEIYEWPRAFLLVYASRGVGQLVDALLDADRDFAVRRRVPRILAFANSQRAVDGLISALGDSRFEIRYHSSRALEFLHRTGENLTFDTRATRVAIERELSVPHTVRDGIRLLDQGLDRADDSSEYAWFLDKVLKDRADKSLELIFSLLALELPEEPLKVAFRAFHSQDAMLRGLALEYLESSLSGHIVAQLSALAEPAPSSKAPREHQQVLDDLMSSHVSILQTLRTPSADALG